jgi:hypothetical protein
MYSKNGSPGSGKDPGEPLFVAHISTAEAVFPRRQNRDVKEGKIHHFSLLVL